MEHAFDYDIKQEGIEKLGYIYKKYIHLKDFSNIIFCICKKYFDSDIDCTPVEDNIIEQVMNYILNHGVFGFNDKDVIGVSYKKNGDSRIKVLFNKAFPSFDIMSDLYPWFKNGKKYMLPYAWCRRYLYLLTNKKKREALGSKFSAIVNDSEDVSKHIEILKIAGLK